MVEAAMEALLYLLVPVIWLVEFIADNWKWLMFGVLGFMIYSAIISAASDKPRRDAELGDRINELERSIKIEIQNLHHKLDSIQNDVDDVKDMFKP
jgi:hypothetical protein